jgi:hypothetical protein
MRYNVSARNLFLQDKQIQDICLKRDVVLRNGLPILQNNTLLIQADSWLVLCLKHQVCVYLLTQMIEYLGLNIEPPPCVFMI